MKSSTRKNIDESKPFRILFDSYKSKVYKIAYYILKNEDDAKEILQEAFIKAFDKIDTLKEYSSFEGWIVRIAFNLAIERYNKNKKEILVDDHDRIISFFTPGITETPEGLLLSKESQEHIRDEIRNLKSYYREVILLYYYAELNYEEISELLNVNIGTVKSRLFRAKEQLRLRLKPQLSTKTGTEGRISNE